MNKVSYLAVLVAMLIVTVAQKILSTVIADAFPDIGYFSYFIEVPVLLIIWIIAYKAFNWIYS